MIWVVSGLLRTGTSMLMQACRAGGMRVVGDAAREAEVQQFRRAGYDPTPGGVWEIPFSTYTRPDFAEAYAGCVVKVFQWALPVLPVADYRVALMRREAADRRRSGEAMLGEAGWAIWELDAQHMPALARDDMDVVTLDYAAVVADPVPAFTTLVAHGWPLDVERAAAVVDPTRSRVRTEAPCPR